MRKPLYNIVIFIFHIITLILLFTLCIHFNVIKLDLLDFSKEAVASFFKNDYVVNIVCTILTAAALYIKFTLCNSASNQNTVVYEFLLAYLLD